MLKDTRRPARRQASSKRSRAPKPPPVKDCADPAEADRPQGLKVDASSPEWLRYLARNLRSPPSDLGRRLRELERLHREGKLPLTGLTGPRTPEGLRKWAEGEQQKRERRADERAREAHEARVEAKRRKGGRRPRLTPEQVKLAQTALRRAIADYNGYTLQKTAIEFVKQYVDGSDSTILRRVIRPVLGPAKRGE